MKVLAFAAVWVAGLLLGLETNVSLAALALFSLAALLLCYLLKSRGYSFWPALLVVVALMALVRVEAGGEPEVLKADSDLSTVTVRGLVVNDPEMSGTGVEFIVSVDAVDNGQGLESGAGKVIVFARPTSDLVQAREEPYFRYGDRLELTGRLEEPPELGDFDYRAYLANQGIHSVLAFPQIELIDQWGGNPAVGFIYDLRRELAKGTDRALPEPQSSLAQALLLGLRDRLPQDVTEDFRSTGTSHLLAISGLHVGVLLALSVGAGVWLLGRRRQLYLLLPLGAIWG